MKSKSKISKRRLAELDDHDIPTVKTESVQEYEQRTGRGFYGNNKNGFHKEKEVTSGT